MKKNKIVNKFILVDDHNFDRKLAFSEVANNASEDLLLCIPGILEKRNTFDPLLSAISQSELPLRAVSVDLCGRGDSDGLRDPNEYNMARYLSDIQFVLEKVISTHDNPKVKVHILGTSMGGILGIYLTSKFDHGITSLILNDVGFSLSWWSIFKLYGVMTQNPDPSITAVPSFARFRANKPLDLAAMATKLGVSKEVIAAVQEPAHFNLPYKSDFLGMRFLDAILPFEGSVTLIHGEDSPICTALQVNEFLKYYPKDNLLQVRGAEHPAPYNDEVCQFIVTKILGSDVVNKRTIDIGTGESADVFLENPEDLPSEFPNEVMYPKDGPAYDAVDPLPMEITDIELSNEQSKVDEKNCNTQPNCSENTSFSSTPSSMPVPKQSLSLSPGRGDKGPAPPDLSPAVSPKSKVSLLSKLEAYFFNKTK